MPATPYARNIWMDGSASMPSTLYLQQHTAAPDQNGVGSESTDCQSGSRVAFTRAVSVDGASSNDVVMETTLTVSETYSWFSVWDANIGGDCWFVGQWLQSRAYTPGNVARVQPGM